MFTKKYESGGFTLIELLVVIAIIGLLATVILASLNAAQSKSRDAKRRAEIVQIQKALELAYDNNGYYPINGWICSNSAGWQTSQLATDLDKYMPSLPVDPVNASGFSYSGAQTYCYYSSGYRAPGQTNQRWYMLIYRLENQNNTLDLKDGSSSCGNASNLLPPAFFNYGGDDGYIITTGGNCI